MMTTQQHELSERASRLVGRVLREKWHLDALIGVGGMAAVYAATHRNGKRVAIKMLHPEMALDSGTKSRFLREGYVANKVGHPGVASVLDDDTSEDGAAYLVMDLLEGETLKARWRRMRKRMPVGDVLRMTHALLDVLVAAHEKEIVHRDLKPDNVFLTEDGSVKVLDFGIARLREASGAADATRSSSMLGTPAFMSPEQARSRWDWVDARTDLWAVGATMFTMLSGQFVHEAGTVTEILVAAATQRARSMRSVVPDIPVRVAAIIDRSLAFEPADRWPDARSMQAAIGEVLAEIAAEEAQAASMSAPDGAQSLSASQPGTADASSQRGGSWAPLKKTVVIPGAPVGADRTAALGGPARASFPSDSGAVSRPSAMPSYQGPSFGVIPAPISSSGPVSSPSISSAPVSSPSISSAPVSSPSISQSPTSAPGISATIALPTSPTTSLDPVSGSSMMTTGTGISRTHEAAPIPAKPLGPPLLLAAGAAALLVGLIGGIIVLRTRGSAEPVTGASANSSAEPAPAASVLSGAEPAPAVSVNSSADSIVPGADAPKSPEVTLAPPEVAPSSTASAASAASAASVKPPSGGRGTKRAPAVPTNKTKPRNPLDKY